MAEEGCAVKRLEEDKVSSSRRYDLFFVSNSRAYLVGNYIS